MPTTSSGHKIEAQSIGEGLHHFRATAGPLRNEAFCNAKFNYRDW